MLLPHKLDRLVSLLSYQDQETNAAHFKPYDHQEEEWWFES